MQGSARVAIVENVQVLRFVAAAVVILAHSFDLRPGSFGVVENFGAVGVDLFFVISGYIITRTAFQDAARPAWHFARQRLRRVVPLYFLLSLPWVLIGVQDGSLSLVRLSATFLFWPSLGYAVSPPLMVIGWTLCFEMLFYAVMTLVLATRWHRSAFVAALLCYILCWIGRDATAASAFQFLGNPIIVEFLFGVGIAIVARRVPARLGAAMLVVGLGGLLLSLLSDYGAISELENILDGELSAARVLQWGVPCALIVAGAVTMPKWGAGAGMGAMVYLGGTSYSLYLAHPLAIYGLEHLLRPLGADHSYLAVALAIAVSVAAGLLVHEWLEKPLIRNVRPAVTAAA
jgi:exopolysaccharide production protein ExoZ